jgi:hypothetical protein
MKYMSKNQHIVPHKNGRDVKGEGNTKATRVVDTQKEAVEIACGISKNQHSELIIHRSNGLIREKDSYGNDTRNIKG